MRLRADYELVAQAADAAGHRARKALRFLIDRTAPAITLRGVEAGRAYQTDVAPWIDIRDANPTVSRHTLNGQPFTSGARLTAEGDYTLRVQATDIAGNVARQSLEFTIDKMSPVIDIQGVQADAVYRGEPYSYQVAAVDSADDALRYALLNAPPGMAIDARTGLITWTPSGSGAYLVTVQVTDTHQAAATQSYVLIVTDPRDAPAITSTPITEAAAGQLYRYQVDAVDANGEPLTFRLEAAPDGMEMDTATGLITWTPQTHGRRDVVIHVENQSGATRHAALHPADYRRGGGGASLDMKDLKDAVAIIRYILQVVSSCCLVALALVACHSGDMESSKRSAEPAHEALYAENVLGRGGDYFGYAVAISGNHVLVGQPHEGARGGAGRNRLCLRASGRPLARGGQAHAG